MREVAGLLALMLLTDARRAARTGPDGELIPLDEQDRSLWDTRMRSQKASRSSRDTLSRGVGGPVSAAGGDRGGARRSAATPRTPTGRRSCALYGVLMRMTDNPMVALNHAIAAAMVHGPHEGLELLEKLDHDPRLAGHYRLDAVRGHLFEMAHDEVSALKHYQLAAGATSSLPERDYLISRAARLTAKKP